MHKLGEQWIEIIDGQEHMLKAVEQSGAGGDECRGCMYNDSYGNCIVFPNGPCVGEQIIIKDLGILKDGILPCPFCGEYPIVKRHDSHWDNEGVKFYIQHVHYPALLYATTQQAIDAWNRRV